MVMATGCGTGTGCVVVSAGGVVVSVVSVGGVMVVSVVGVAVVSVGCVTGVGVTNSSLCSFLQAMIKTTSRHSAPKRFRVIFIIPGLKKGYK